MTFPTLNVHGCVLLQSGLFFHVEMKPDTLVNVLVASLCGWGSAGCEDLLFICVRTWVSFYVFIYNNTVWGCALGSFVHGTYLLSPIISNVILTALQ